MCLAQRNNNNGIVRVVVELLQPTMQNRLQLIYVVLLRPTWSCTVNMAIPATLPVGPRMVAGCMVAYVFTDVMQLQVPQSRLPRRNCVLPVRGLLTH